jgi:hypothetical protein
MGWINLESLMRQDLEEPKKFLFAPSFSLDYRYIYVIFYNISGSITL